MRYVAPIMLGLLLGGCTGAYFGNTEQHKKGDWYFLAGSEETARIRQDQLALEKLKNQPVQTRERNGVIQGYKGVISNLSAYRRVNLIISGPETIGFYLEPGDKKEVYLIPGRYKATAYHGGRFDSEWSFPVGTQKHFFRGEMVHWYLVYDK